MKKATTKKSTMMYKDGGAKGPGDGVKKAAAKKKPAVKKINTLIA